MPHGRRAVLAAGGKLSLWNPLLLNWMVWMRRNVSDIGLRTQVGLPEGLVQQVSERVLDLAVVVHSPWQWPGLQVEMIMEETLVLVTSEQVGSDVADPDYVYVNWGSDFASRHGMNFPQFSNPALFVGLGPLGMEYIAQAGGVGYFRRSAVEPLLATGRRRLVPDAPTFAHPVYAIYSEVAETDVLGTALDGLRKLAHEP